MVVKIYGNELGVKKDKKGWAGRIPHLRVKKTKV